MTRVKGSLVANKTFNDRWYFLKDKRRARVYEVGNVHSCGPHKVNLNTSSYFLNAHFKDSDVKVIIPKEML